MRALLFLVIGLVVASILITLVFNAFNDDNPSNVSNTTPDASFHGYPCTVDCSGHEAGYDWAEKHDITDPDDCSGNSQSFIEGCKSYAEEN